VRHSLRPFTRACRSRPWSPVAAVGCNENLSQAQETPPSPPEQLDDHVLLREINHVLNDIDLGEFDVDVSPFSSPPPVIYTGSVSGSVPVVTSPVVAEVVGEQSVIVAMSGRGTPSDADQSILQESSDVEEVLPQEPSISFPDSPRLRVADLWTCVRSVPPSEIGETVDRLRRRYATDMTGPELRLALSSFNTARSNTAREVRDYMTASILSSNNAGITLLQLYTFVDNLAAVVPDEL